MRHYGIIVSIVLRQIYSCTLVINEYACFCHGKWGGGGEGARIIRQTADQNLVVAFLGRRFCTKQNNLP